MFFAFLVRAFSDLGQEFSGRFYVVLCPRMDRHVAGRKDFWHGELARRDQACQRDVMDAQLGGNFARRKSLWHSPAM